MAGTRKATKLNKTLRTEYRMLKEGVPPIVLIIVLIVSPRPGGAQRVDHPGKCSVVVAAALVVVCTHEPDESCTWQ